MYFGWEIPWICCIIPKFISAKIISRFIVKQRSYSSLKMWKRASLQELESIYFCDVLFVCMHMYTTFSEIFYAPSSAETLCMLAQHAYLPLLLIRTVQQSLFFPTNWLKILTYTPAFRLSLLHGKEAQRSTWHFCLTITISMINLAVTLQELDKYQRQTKCQDGRSTYLMDNYVRQQLCWLNAATDTAYWCFPKWYV